MPCRYRYACGTGKLISFLQDVEAILHCINSVQEAVELSENPYLETVFSADILGRLPSTGSDRVRVTALNVIGKQFMIKFCTALF